MPHRNSRGTALGGHHKPREGTSTIWLTPPAILHALGKFDLDPCACEHPRPWPTANLMIYPPANGLEANWFGRVFCNPPYDDSLERWLYKCAIHQNATALTFARTETRAWQTVVWAMADSILFVTGRIDFYYPDGSRAKNAGGPSALIAFDRQNTEKLAESGIPGALVTGWHRKRIPSFPVAMELQVAIP